MLTAAAGLRRQRPPRLPADAAPASAPQRRTPPAPAGATPPAPPPASRRARGPLAQHAPNSSASMGSCSKQTHNTSHKERPHLQLPEGRQQARLLALAPPPSSLVPPPYLFQLRAGNSANQPARPLGRQAATLLGSRQAVHIGGIAGGGPTLTRCTQLSLPQAAGLARGHPGAPTPASPAAAPAPPPRAWPAPVPPPA